MNTANISANLMLSIYSELLLLFLLVASLKQKSVFFQKKAKSFLAFILITALEFIADIVSRLDGSSGQLFELCKIGNYVLFILNPVLVLLWFIYVCDQIEIKHSTRISGFIIQLVFCVINAVFVIFNAKTQWLYYFDSNNVYHRGVLFPVTSAIMLIMIICIEIMLVSNRRLINKNHFFALLVFPIIPVVATFLQVFFYGIAWGLHGTVISLLIVSFYVQNRSLDIDYLTGLYNRRKLDLVMQQKISASKAGQSFSAITLDINNFKSINDTLGHQAGDAALIEAANILRGILRANTFVARFGGDEFSVILDIDNPDQLEGIVNRIRRATEDFNKKDGRIYAIVFSIGAEVYQPEFQLSTAEFQKHIDLLMYEDKRMRAAAGAPKTAVLIQQVRRSSDQESK